MSKFGEYMYSLLFAVLRRGKKLANQFYIFCQVAGHSFDRVKETFTRVREESSVLTCSVVMLPVHGADRDMPRLRGETLENYRIRLALKGIIAENAGTNNGIYYLAKGFGYDRVVVEPGEKPAHWAEATVRMIGGNIVLADRELLLWELDKIKPARTILHLFKEQQYSATPTYAAARIVGREMILRQE